VGVTRLAASSRGLSDARVAFVPLVDDHVSTVVAWRPDDDRPLLRALLELCDDLAAADALVPAGWGPAPGADPHPGGAGSR